MERIKSAIIPAAVLIACALTATIPAAGCSKKDAGSVPAQSSAQQAAVVTCPHCGAQLPPESLVRPSRGSPVVACPKCGARIPPPTSAASK